MAASAHITGTERRHGRNRNMPGTSSRIKRAVKPLFGPFSPRDDDELSYDAVFQQLRKWNNDQASPCYSFNHYQLFVNIARRHGAADPGSVLELGPGAQLGTLYCFLAAGATRAAGLDIAPTTKQLGFFQLLHRYLVHVSSFRWWRPPGTETGYRYPDLSWDQVDVEALVDRIEYHAPFEAYRTPFADCDFDLIYSGAAMEHFDKPRETVKEIFRVLKPGGVTIHGIDLRSHATGELSHLIPSESAYQKLTQKYDETHGIKSIISGDWSEQVYCNRVLAGDWRRHFEQEGFEILEFDTVLSLDPGTINPVELSSPYSEQAPEDLAPLVIVIAARKPVDEAPGVPAP